MGKNGNNNYCTYCGKQIAVDDIYCPHCGNKQEVQMVNGSDNGIFNRIKIRVKLFFNSPRQIEPEEYENNGFSWIWKNKVSKFIKIIIYIAIFIALANIIAIYNIIKYFVGFRWPDLICICIYLLVDILTICYILHFYKKSTIRRKWYHKLIKAVSLFLIIVSLISAIIHIEFLYEHHYSNAKEKYRIMGILHSGDTKKIENLIDQEYCGDSWYSYNLRKSDIDNTIQSMAYKGNAIAQGILADVYFSKVANLIYWKNRNNDDYEFDESGYDDRIIKSQNRGFYWAKKAAEQGDKRGAYHLGQCYAERFEELNISKNLDLACKYWEISASKGYGMAYYKLGQLYGTWTLVNALVITDSGTIYGADLDNEHRKIIRRYPMPDKWRHDIKKARQYWHKALECGGEAAQLAKDAIEKVYMEEISENDSISL